jgi:hypothetical protein
MLSSMMAAPAAAPSVGGGGVTEADIREEFRKHGRLETMQLAQNLKHKIGNNKQQFIELLKRVATVTPDPTGKKKYLVLK